MGLATRIIPTLLARGDQLVKGQRFDSWRSVGHVLQAARVHAARGVDELAVLDILATPAGRGPNLGLIEKICERAFTPITVGGGVRSVQDVRDLLKAGADKVAFGTGAITPPGLMAECSSTFGKQAIVACLDYTDMVTVWIRGERRSTGQTPVGMANHFVREGAGEIMLTSINREGTMEGYDLDTIREVSGAVSVPVIAHGGCGSPEHMHEALKAGASAVAAGAMFQFTDVTPRGCAQYLASKGHEVRL